MYVQLVGCAPLLGLCIRNPGDVCGILIQSKGLSAAHGITYTATHYYAFEPILTTLAWKLEVNRLPGGADMGLFLVS